MIEQFCAKPLAAKHGKATLVQSLSLREWI